MAGEWVVSFTLHAWHAMALAALALALGSLLPGQRQSGRATLLFMSAVLLSAAAVNAPAIAGPVAAGLSVVAAFTAGVVVRLPVEPARTEWGAVDARRRRPRRRPGDA